MSVLAERFLRALVTDNSFLHRPVFISAACKFQSRLKPSSSASQADLRIKPATVPCFNYRGTLSGFSVTQVQSSSSFSLGISFVCFCFFWSDLGGASFGMAWSCTYPRKLPLRTYFTLRMPIPPQQRFMVHREETADLTCMQNMLGMHISSMLQDNKEAV